MIIPLKSLLPTADDVLNAELETLGGLFLRHLKSCEGKSPVFQHAGLNRGYFIAVMERRNVGLGPLPSKDPEYGARQPAVTQAFVEAWDWLVREGLLIRNHEQPAEWYLISRQGERFLQNVDRRGSENVRANTDENSVNRKKSADGEKWDVFISHASEDKPYVAPLAVALRAAGVSVWYDNMLLTWGDDLRPMIDNGLVNCRFGLVILSKAFLGKKKWTEHELNGLFAREQAGQKLVLPIWHGITRDDLLAYSPALADRLAKIAGNDSESEIVRSLLDLLGRTSPAADASIGDMAAGVRIRDSVSGVQTELGSHKVDDLNPREIELLWNAVKDPKGEICHSVTLNGEGMRANARQFLEGADARMGAEWLGALRSLEASGLIEPLSDNRDFFRVTSNGYEAADGLEGFARWNAESVVLRAHYMNAPLQELIIGCQDVIAIPARYFNDQFGLDGSVARSLKERRSLLIEGVDQRPPKDWSPTEVEFSDKITGQVEVFRVEGAEVIPPSRLKLPILD